MLHTVYHAAAFDRHTLYLRSVSTHGYLHTLGSRGIRIGCFRLVLGLRGRANGGVLSRERRGKVGEMKRDDVAAAGSGAVRGRQRLVDRGYCAVILPQPLLDEMRELKQRTGTTQSHIVALALDDYLRRRAQVVPSDPPGETVTAVDDTDDSAAHDEGGGGQ